MAESSTYSGNGHIATIADPENITRDECLALALCGADEWNKWRVSHPVRGGWSEPYKNLADFTGQDFSTEFVDFGSFQFGNGADFSGSKFFQVIFNDAQFGRDARFTDVLVEEWASFSAAKFGTDAGFDRCRFGDSVSFEECQFDSRATFVCSHFGQSLSMQGAVLGDGACFDWARFGQRSSFIGALLVGDATFVATTIGPEADFSGLLVGGSLSFEAAVFEGQTKFVGLSWGALNQQVRVSALLERLAKDRQASPWVFKSISFQGARFEGSVDFSDRHFEGVTEFTRTRFPIFVPFMMEDRISGRTANDVVSFESGQVGLPEGRHVVFATVPEFFQCKLHQNSSFDGAIFPTAQGTDEAARAYRVLKQAFSTQQATREEQRFFRLEMAEEAKAAENSSDPAQWLYIAYRELADFGFSVRRPALLLGVTLLLMLPLYAWQAGLQACWTSSADCSMTGPLIQFASAHALPGFEKLAEPASRTLFGDQLGVWTVLTLLLHKAISVLALFLIGLALRNLFKMK